ncbi:MAG: hypothetical protein M9952_14440 [Microthrixaceae bacterium]|nr:hypothetical protein [Microthrixaceae bacterium]
MEQSGTDGSLDDFLQRVDDVLDRAFPVEPASAEKVEGAAGAEAAAGVERLVVSRVSDERQRQLERLGDPDNESW